MYTKIATVTLNEDKKGQGAAEVFIAQVTPDKENLAGKLFILLEVEAKRSDAQKIINFIITDINANYYQNEKILLRERIDALKIENIFETVLVKTNKNLLDYLAQEKIQISPRNINATIGIIYQNELHFSNIGKNKALLLYREEGEENYKMINVEKNEDEQHPEGLSWKKLFSSIVSGEMPNKSYFIFANESLAEYLFNKELIEIITKLAPLGAAEQIKNTLARINSYIPFLGIIIKNTLANSDDLESQVTRAYPPVELEKPTPPTITPSYQSRQANTTISLQIAGLSSTEHETEKILGATPVVSRQRISRFCSRFFRAINPFRLLIKLVKTLFKRPEPKIINTPVTALDKAALLSEMPRKKRWSQALLIILGLAVILFAGNLVFKQKANKQQEVTQKSQTNEEIILQKENQIDSYLLYNDEDKAKNLVFELQELFNKLSPEEKQAINKYEDLYKKFEEQSAKIQHVAIIEDLKELANFSAFGADVQPENIIITNVSDQKKLYAADNEKKTIYKINLQDNVTAIINSEKIKQTISQPFLSKNGTISYLDNKQIIQLNTKNDQLNFIALNHKDDQTLNDINFYNDRLYALDKNNNQLYRYTLTNNIYDKGEPRLKDKLDMTDINSFAIDNVGTKSDVYFLKATGEVKKFYDGLEQRFALDAVDPIFKRATQILVQKNIYILEPDNKRLVIFDKAGKFIKQFQSDKFNDLRDVFVDEANKKIYILNNNIVYEMGL